MVKTVSVLGFAILVALAIVGFSGSPKLGNVEAKASLSTEDDCSTREIALDEGYGVTRKVLKRVCSEE